MKDIDHDTNTCMVQIENGDEKAIPGHLLEPVRPSERNDKFIVISGADKDKTGVLISVDGNDGVARMNDTRDMQMMNIEFLAKLSE